MKYKCIGYKDCFVNTEVVIGWNVFPEHSLLVVLLDLFMAGADTTSTTLSWAFLYMSLNHAIQGRVQNEIDLTIGSQKPSFEHRKMYLFLYTYSLNSESFMDNGQYF